MGISVEKIPLPTRAEVNKYERIAESGWELSNHNSVPTSWMKGKTFLEDEFLKNRECTSDEKHFYFRCKCYHSFSNRDVARGGFQGFWNSPFGL